jgi:hypothetical protein
MAAKTHERGARLLELKMMKPVLRAYALGYASSTIPRLLGLLRSLRRKDKPAQETLDVVSVASGHLLLSTFRPYLCATHQKIWRIRSGWGLRSDHSRSTAPCTSTKVERLTLLRSCTTSSEPRPKSTASRRRAQSLSEGQLSFRGFYGPFSSHLLKRLEAVPRSYSRQQQALGSASSVPSSQRGSHSIYSIVTLAGHVSAPYHGRPVSSSLFKTRPTSTTDHHPRRHR